MIGDILLHISVYPRPMSLGALRGALDLAVTLGGHVTAIVTKPLLTAPFTFYPSPRTILRHFDAQQDELERAVEEVKLSFEKEADKRALAHESKVVPTSELDVAYEVIECARLRNLTLLPFVPKSLLWSDLAKGLIFDSGRPVIVLPEVPISSFKFGSAVIAWDFSRAASRAVQDALPLLQRVSSVRAVVITGKKRPAESSSSGELVKHLSRNGVNAMAEEIGRRGRPIGQAIEEEASNADLLVMGAFGHSRMHDFILGGATRHILDHPTMPVFLSH